MSAGVEMVVGKEERMKEIVEKVKEAAQEIKAHTWFLARIAINKQSLNEKALVAAMAVMEAAASLGEASLAFTVFEDIVKRNAFEEFLSRAHRLYRSALDLAREYTAYDDERGEYARGIEELAAKIEKLIDEGYKLLW